MLALILVCQTKCFDGGRLQPRLETVWWFMDESTLRAFDCTRQCTMFSSSLITQSHTKHSTLDSVKQHQDLQHCFSAAATPLSNKFYFCSVTRNGSFQNSNGLFSESVVFWKWTDWSSFIVMCVQHWELWHAVCAQRHRKSWKRTAFRLRRSEFPKLVGVLMSHFNFI